MRVRNVIFAAVAVAGVIRAQTSWSQSADETAKLVQNLQDSWNKKDGTQWATSFAPEHDYVVFTGRFLPKMTPKDNASAHQQVFDGMYKDVDLALHVAKIRSLMPEIGVVHIEGYRHAKGKPDERQGEMMITAVVQKFPTGWKIVAFQNTLVQQSGKEVTK
jgi:uncharacterized protein (TIGR02246 family)